VVWCLGKSSSKTLPVGCSFTARIKRLLEANTLSKSVEKYGGWNLRHYFLTSTVCFSLMKARIVGTTTGKVKVRMLSPRYKSLNRKPAKH